LFRRVGGAVALGDEEVEVLRVAEVTVVAMEELGGVRVKGAVVAMMVVEVVAVLAVAAVVLVGEGGEVAVEGVGIDPPP
jgi:hypothetical protein